jgi:hypothetical protein
MNRKRLPLLSLLALVLAFASIKYAGAQQPLAIKSAVPDVARPLPLTAVRVTGGPLKRAMDLNGEYLLKLEPDRMVVADN